MNAPPPIPALCGSTTLSASMVAIAASVALPPLRKISAPAAAARGSAAETMPGADVAATLGWRMGRASVAKGRAQRASPASSSRRVEFRFNIGGDTSRLGARRKT